MILEILRGDYSVVEGKKVELGYALGSPDGITVNRYTKGRTYEFPESLGQSFIRKGKGKVVSSKPKKATNILELEEAEQKKIQDANANKMKLGENKDGVPSHTEAEKAKAVQDEKDRLEAANKAQHGGK